MFPDEVFLTLCCPKAEITEAYSIGETAINIPADAPIPIEIELTSTSLIGDLKGSTEHYSYGGRTRKAFWQIHLDL